MRSTVSLEHDPCHRERLSLGGRQGPRHPPHQRNAGAGGDHDAKPPSARSGRSAHQAADGAGWIAAHRLRSGRNGQRRYRGASRGLFAANDQADADHPADGSGRMRRRGAGDGARLSRRMGPAGAAAHRLRRVARRQQGEQHPQGGARFGLAAKGFRKEPSTLQLHCRCPASSTGTSITSWCWRASTATSVFINDPAIGRAADRHGRARSSFTGVVLALEPAPDFKRRGASRNGLRLLLRELRQSKSGRRSADHRQRRARRAGHRVRRLLEDLRRRHPDPAHRAAGCVPLLIGMAVTALLRAL